MVLLGSFSLKGVLCTLTLHGLTRKQFLLHRVEVLDTLHLLPHPNGAWKWIEGLGAADSLIQATKTATHIESMHRGSPCRPRVYVGCNQPAPPPTPDQIAPPSIQRIAWQKVMELVTVSVVLFTVLLSAVILLRRYKLKDGSPRNLVGFSYREAS